MRLAVGLLAALSGLSCSQAFATEPGPAASSPPGQQPATAQSTASIAPAVATPPAAPAASTSASATQSTTAGKKPALTAQEKRLISQGYELEVHKDQKYFCRSEPTLGSHFSHKTCQTEEQLLATTRESQDVTKQLQSPTGSYLHTPGQ